MDDYKRLLLANRIWAEEKLEVDARYFDGLAKAAPPKFLWIGSSESSVPPAEITGTGPGEIIVHRNVANVVSVNDMNLLSVLEYAVEHLGVEHIILCGHYGCSAVKQALGHGQPGSFLTKWLYNVKAVYASHKGELDMHTDEKRKWDRLVELNVMEQVQNLARTAIVQRAWHQHKRPVLHGWVFNNEDGLLQDLLEVKPGGLTDDVYTFDFD